jgi:curli biogenesis system outer membrane secretion channel CsgG
MRGALWVLVAMIGFGLGGCATSDGPVPASSTSHVSEATTDTRITFPPCTGPQRKIQVVQIRIPAEDLNNYPELAEKRVGFGLSNLLVESLFETGRFALLEEKADLLRRLVEQWELTEDGILVKDPKATETALQAADFLLYAQVFDFVACSPSERIGVAQKKQSCVTSVGAQVRIVSTATGEYIPGSTDPMSSEGKYIHTVTHSLFSSPQEPYDQSAVGKASWKAVRYALLQALQRFDREGW